MKHKGPTPKSIRTFLKEFIHSSFTALGHEFSVMELTRFAIVGFSSGVVYAATIMLVMVLANTSYSLATVPAYLMSMTINYTLQRTWTFKSDRAHNQAIPRYLFVQFVGMLINWSVVTFVIEQLNWHFLIAQVFAIGMIAIWSYTSQKIWVFSLRGLR